MSQNKSLYRHFAAKNIAWWSLAPLIVGLFIFSMPGSSGLIGSTPAPRLIRKQIGPHTELRFPSDFKPWRAKKMLFRKPGFELRLYTRSPAQGMIFYAEIIPDTSKKKSIQKVIRLRFAGRNIKFVHKRWGYRALFAIPPYLKPGKKYLYIWIKDRRARKRRYAFPLWIRRTKYKTYYSSLDLGKFSRSNYLKKNPRFYRMIKANRKKKAKVFRLRSTDMLKERLSHPRNKHRITSYFYARRYYRRYVLRKGKRSYRKPRISRHGGTDFYGRPGAPVYAIADGRVAIAEKMYYEGNIVVIDHGNKILSFYMHQSKLLVREGDGVRAGQKIGEVGATGMVTGPHLHVAIYLGGIKADVLSLLSLPIRN